MARLGRSQPIRPHLARPPAGGGTTFTQSLSGSLAASATLARSIARPISGSLASSGSLARRAGKALAGSLSASATIARAVGKALAGTLSAAGSLGSTPGALKSGLAAYWPLDEASGDAADSAGSNTLADSGTVGTA